MLNGLPKKVFFTRDHFYRCLINLFSDLSHFNNSPILAALQSTDSQNRIPPLACASHFLPHLPNQQIHLCKKGCRAYFKPCKWSGTGRKQYFHQWAFLILKNKTNFDTICLLEIAARWGCFKCLTLVFLQTPFEIKWRSNKLIDWEQKTPLGSFGWFKKSSDIFCNRFHLFFNMRILMVSTFLEYLKSESLVTRPNIT